MTCMYYKYLIVILFYVPDVLKKKLLFTCETDTIILFHKLLLRKCIICY